MSGVWSYTQALDWLEGLLNYERSAVPYAQIKLQRIQALLQRLGNPQDRLRSALVAGTKGKGSTAAILVSILQAHGQRVGFYSKPHLEHYRERIRINDALVSPDQLARLVQDTVPAVEVGAEDPWGKPTYFEVSVALALRHFVEERVHRAVLEVGIGGRLDATNACHPEVSIVTPISYDHTDVLGSTLQEIAREKAGILRPGRILVSAPQPPEAERVLEQACRELGVRWVRVGREVRFQVEASDLGGLHLWVRTDAGWYGKLRLPLLGRHQATNAAVAVAAAEAWLTQDGARLDPHAVREGLWRVRWPARQELLAERPWVLVDVAHNPASMAALRATLEELFGDRRVVVVVGMVRGHEVRQTLWELLPVADELVATTPDHVRAVPASELAEVVAEARSQVHVVEPCEEAVAWALGRCGAEDVLVITGSFFVAGPARRALLARAQPAPVS
ncbi:MAG: bifunctional folylpolyglutamate synthase/dihydrofolate synthase [candidate division GAL15 bacterium]